MRTTTSRHALRVALPILLCAAAGVSHALGEAYRLERASVDGAGGGVAESPQYRIVLAFGQHDAGVVSAGGRYAYLGGVFAQVPADTLFVDGFED